MTFQKIFKSAHKEVKDFLLHQSAPIAAASAKRLHLIHDYNRWALYRSNPLRDRMFS